MDDFWKISDYAFLSDCRSAALVAPDASVEWLCWPRFDSESIFASILDRDAGSFKLHPTHTSSIQRAYAPKTNVLETRFETETGVAKVIDWLHVGARQSLCRLVIVEEGEMEFLARVDARPDYALKQAEWLSRAGYLTSEVSDSVRLILDGFHIAWQGGVRTTEVEEVFTLKEGEKRAFSLSLNRPGPSNMPDSLHRAIDFWRDWAEGLRLTRSVYPDVVLRSALTLKGLQYAPTGAIIAAATTSLPERIGGDRNYDYRYSWLRDAVFTLFALRSAGSHREADSYFDWLKAITMRTGDASLKLMYGVEGESDLTERDLDHLSGHRSSRPVRVGNAAAWQTQLDTYGELADAIWIHHRRSDDKDLNPHRWMLLKGLAARAAREWHRKDHGIWEIRGEEQHYVLSKVQCWVALDRAIRLSRKAPEHLVDKEELEEWKKERTSIKEEVMEKGWDEQLGAFTQYYGSKSLDASNLLLARVGFVKATDEKFISTVRSIQKTLTHNGLVYRYDAQSVDDDFREGGDEGTFTICSLWMVLALLEIHSPGEARILYERVVARGSDVGLFAEELNPVTGEQLGNFPQAFTHIALIVCAFALDHAENGPPPRDDALPKPLSSALFPKDLPGAE